MLWLDDWKGIQSVEVFTVPKQFLEVYLLTFGDQSNLE